MADDQTDGGSPESPGQPADEFDGLVLDDSFVRGGAYEPPARTRLAIAKYGDQPSSWRHGGGLRRGAAQPIPQRQPTRPRRPARRGATRAAHPSLPSPAMARLPFIVTAIVVALAAFLVFR